MELVRRLDVGSGEQRQHSDHVGVGSGRGSLALVLADGGGPGAEALCSPMSVGHTPVQDGSRPHLVGGVI